MLERSILNILKWNHRSINTVGPDPDTRMDRLAAVGNHIAVAALVGTVVDIVEGSQVGMQVVDIAVGMVEVQQIGVRFVGTVDILGTVVADTAPARVPADRLVVVGRPVAALPGKLAAW